MHSAAQDIREALTATSDTSRGATTPWVPSPVRFGTGSPALAASERQLRNLFAEGVGVSPKAHADTAPWAQLAAATGYYDQSHMTADFRALMGVPPRSFFTGLLPRATPCGMRN
ncbi:helix-turn-helix domain-containing protein [Streptomyces cupreus]|uniref:helix-turn-helix domain-containing protein n=1 Tax=Streptomyces cupreus TaxID=2759956 RepID=UPI003AB98488